MLQCIGTFGFITTLPALLLVITARWLQHASHIAEIEAAGAARPRDVGWRCFRAELAVQNRRLLIAGLFVALGASGVAAFQWVNVRLRVCSGVFGFHIGFAYDIQDLLLFLTFGSCLTAIVDMRPCIARR